MGIFAAKHNSAGTTKHPSSARGWRKIHIRVSVDCDWSSYCCSYIAPHIVIWVQKEVCELLIMQHY